MSEANHSLHKIPKIKKLVITHIISILNYSMQLFIIINYQQVPQPHNNKFRTSYVIVVMADSKEVDRLMVIQSFFKEATSELLYNIVSDRQLRDNDDGEISYLQDEFKEKVGYQPIEFFGLGDITTDEDWFAFLNQSHGLSLYRTNISINEGDKAVYQDYNTSYLHDPKQSVAKYREVLLVRACKLIAKDGQYAANVNNQDENSGNTPLHLVAALPGVAHDKPILFEYLLEAGADPLQENKEGLNVLHIIAGRMKAEEDQEDELHFGSKRVDASSWETGQALSQASTFRDS